MGEAQSQQSVATPAAETLEAELARIAALDLDQVRTLWREMTQRQRRGACERNQPMTDKKTYEEMTPAERDARNRDGGRPVVSRPEDA
jgi:hypothetical protein